jgi:peroxiredoxin
MRRAAHTPAALPLIALALVVLTTSACFQLGSSSTTGVGESAPAFRLKTLEGAEVQLTDFAGKLVLLDFWATWCGPCHEQSRILKGLAGKLEAQGVEILAVNSGEDEQTVRTFAARSPFPYPVLLDTDDAYSAKLDVAVLPTVVLIDRQGRIAAFHEGVLDEETLDAEIKRAGG